MVIFFRCILKKNNALKQEVIYYKRFLESQQKLAQQSDAKRVVIILLHGDQKAINILFNFVLFHFPLVSFKKENSSFHLQKTAQDSTSFTCDSQITTQATSPLQVPVSTYKQTQFKYLTTVCRRKFKQNQNFFPPKLPTSTK